MNVHTIVELETSDGRRDFFVEVTPHEVMDELLFERAMKFFEEQEVSRGLMHIMWVCGEDHIPDEFGDEPFCSCSGQTYSVGHL